MPSAAERAGNGRTVAVDTSVAVALLVRSHEAHRAVARWAAGRELALCGHALIETYAVLTRLPGTARVLPEDAVRLLTANFVSPPASRPAPLEAVERFVAAGVAGGAAYDAWVALGALEQGLTLASRDARAEPTYRRLGLAVEVVT